MKKKYKKELRIVKFFLHNILHFPIFPLPPLPTPEIPTIGRGFSDKGERYIDTAGISNHQPTHNFPALTLGKKVAIEFINLLNSTYILP